jgi:hypothetical protein
MSPSSNHTRKTIFALVGILAAVGLFWSLPASVHAQGLKLVGCAAPGGTGDCTINDIVQQAIYFAEFIMGLAGSLFLVIFIYGGALYLASFGTAKYAQKGKDAMVKSTIGIVLVLGAWTIVSYVATSIGYTGGGGAGGGAAAGTQSAVQGSCKCSGAIKSGALMPNSMFDEYCAQAKSYCSKCGGGSADCVVSFNASKDDCTKADDDPKTFAQSKLNVPSAAMSFIDVEASCAYVGK